MVEGRRRHVQRRPSTLAPLLVWAVPAILVGCAVAVLGGVAVGRVVAAGAAAVVGLGVLWAIDRAGLMRPPRPVPTGSPDSTDSTDDTRRPPDESGPR